MFPAEPLFFNLGKSSDFDWLGQCEQTIKKYPLFSVAGAAGKFTSNYAVWAFDINSDLHIIKKLKDLFNQKKTSFQNL